MILSPSLLSANFGCLKQELDSLESSGLKWVHWDVMDGIFVPNITFGAHVIKQLRASSSLFFDVHLMITQPERYILDFFNAGADLLVVHAEATNHLDRVLQSIKELGIKSGVALNPATPICVLENILDKVDLILVMSVNPGFGGQKFISQSINKIIGIQKLISGLAKPPLIQVDGGVTPDNTKILMDAGASVLVSGSSFFSYPPYKERLELFEQSAPLELPLSSKLSILEAKSWFSQALANK